MAIGIIFLLINFFLKFQRIASAPEVVLIKFSMLLITQDSINWHLQEYLT